MDASHTQFLQPIDITSMDANIWASSKAKEVLMGPSIQSTGSLGSKSRTRQFPATPSFDNSFLPWARNDAILSGSSQRAEHGYNFETASQAPFDTNTPTSPGMRQVGKSTEFPSPFKAGHNGDMKEYRSASIVDVDAISPKSNHLTSPWASENIATNTDHNPRSALMTSPTQFTGASSSSSNSWANAQPFSNGDHPPAVASRPILPPGRSEAAYDQPPKADEVSCFEKVLEAIDEAGFDSIDSMIAAYYTSVFPLGSPLHSVQALSRKRHLKKLFAVLHESAKGWDAQELQNHRDGVMSCAEDILIDEMLALDLDSHKRAGKDTMIAKLESIIASKESNEVIKSNRKVFQQEVCPSSCRSIPLEVVQPLTEYKQAPETWGLLTELGNAMNIKSPQTASIVSAFLSLLAD